LLHSSTVLSVRRWDLLFVGAGFISEVSLVTIVVDSGISSMLCRSIVKAWVLLDEVVLLLLFRRKDCGLRI
jgi:hypothetical protein